MKITTQVMLFVYDDSDFPESQPKLHAQFGPLTEDEHAILEEFLLNVLYKDQMMLTQSFRVHFDAELINRERLRNG